jgi:hypothetical protein
MSKIKDVVSWIMQDEPLLKLKNADETYDIKENVFEVIKKKKLYEKEDFPVEVEIDKNEGENGLIIYLIEIDSNKQVESKDATKSVSDDKDNVIKELTVHGVSVAKKGVIFKEEEKVWYTLDDSINAQVFKDECTGKTIEVIVVPTENGNDIIKGFTKKEEEKDENPEEESGKEKRKYNNASNSIEAQASLKCAKVIVASMVDKDSKPDFVLKLITRIAEHAYKTIQDLKNKE